MKSLSIFFLPKEISSYELKPPIKCKPKRNWEWKWDGNFWVSFLSPNFLFNQLNTYSNHQLSQNMHSKKPCCIICIWRCHSRHWKQQLHKHFNWYSGKHISIWPNLLQISQWQILWWTPHSRFYWSEKALLSFRLLELTS